MYIPRDFQIEARDAPFVYWQKNDGHPLISAGTGSGKSFISAMIIKEAFRQYADARVLLVSHVSEILQQDLEKLLLLWPDAPVGVYSASLGQRKVHTPIVIAGIQ